MNKIISASIILLIALSSSANTNSLQGARLTDETTSEKIEFEPHIMAHKLFRGSVVLTSEHLKRLTAKNSKLICSHYYTSYYKPEEVIAYNKRVLTFSENNQVTSDYFVINYEADKEDAYPSATWKFTASGHTLPNEVTYTNLDSGKKHAIPAVSTMRYNDKNSIPVLIIETSIDNKESLSSNLLFSSSLDASRSVSRYEICVAL